MEYAIQGVVAGLLLAILLGPIFIAITETSIQHGGEEGMAVGLGIWISDLIIIIACYLFVRALNNVINSSDFKIILGLSGGVIMILFGIGSWFKQIDLNAPKKKMTVKSFSGFFMKGFLVNTINPFTFIFWISVISSYVIGKKVSNTDVIIFLVAILLTIIITDSLKVFLAKSLRKFLQDGHIRWFSRIAGIGMMLGGLYLFFEVSKEIL